MKRLDTYAQHFLRSPRLVAELVGHSNIRRNDLVYDLGAGSGVITSVLARRAREVIAVETEPHALEKLRQNVGSSENVSIINSDILALALPEIPYKVFANIPFSLSSQVVQKLSFSQHPPKATYLIVQKQFANKLLADTNHFTSQLGAQLTPFYTVRIRKPLHKTDFTPPPGVDTVLLEIKPRPEPHIDVSDMASYREFIEAIYTNQKFYRTLDRAALGISPETNPARLSANLFAKLYQQQQPRRR